MKRNLINGLHLWQFDILSRYPSIGHFVTDRRTLPEGEEFTLSFSSHADKDFIRKNRAALATAIGLPSEALVFPSQVHKTRIVNVTRETLKEELMETDALITAEPDICVAVMSADCVPILLYDTQHDVVAAVHSGWRGTVAKILTLTLEEMRSRFGTKGSHIVAGIGPSVSQESYEVGGEVVEAVRNSFKDKDLMITKPNDKANLDLWKANRIQLLEFGVTEKNIEVSDLCSVKNNAHFFSARKGDAGRFAAGIYLKKA
jgi:polyphenol oxidase